jgi:hypothetical protein
MEQVFGEGRESHGNYDEADESSGDPRANLVERFGLWCPAHEPYGNAAQRQACSGISLHRSQTGHQNLQARDAQEPSKQNHGPDQHRKYGDAARESLQLGNQSNATDGIFHGSLPIRVRGPVEGGVEIPGARYSFRICAPLLVVKAAGTNDVEGGITGYAGLSCKARFQNDEPTSWDTASIKFGNISAEDLWESWTEKLR